MMSSRLSKNILIEAVPNFSEGRRVDVLDAIAEAIAVPGVYLLDRSSDADHNRSVFTIAGAPDAVREGLFRAVRVASERINLFEQQGVHPRLGATDVVPLVPLRGCTLADCARWARQLGARIGQELDLPVYLYEASATRPERRNLADVRRGQFERLVIEIKLPYRQPDFGPAQVGSAGAVIVGARQFLIAYNVYLQSTDVRIAKAISRSIRESSGGLPAVKALGLLVDGRAQVSMNLTDYTRTSLYTVLVRIAHLAAEHGTAIDHSELIGLLPTAAVLGNASPPAESAARAEVLAAAAARLHLPSLRAEQLVEGALEKAQRLVK